jgi:non-specific serine/threonine protein kinase
MIGQTISHYNILEKLGGGGMGVVYKAEDIKLKRLVALKFLPPDLTRDDEAKERFVHEAQAASALDHPNICTIYEIDETEDGQLFIAMAYYKGETLKKKIDRGPLPLDEALNLAIQVVQGLERAHEAGIIHRDIKPANIMITERGEVKIVDFGLAKLAGRTRLTKSGSTVGTVAYMSPEQAQGMTSDHRTDLWSWGVVFYEMLTGRLPFEAEYEQAVIYSILHEQPQPMSNVRTEAPEELQQIVDKAMAKNPDERYQNAEELLAELRQANRDVTAETLLPRPEKLPKFIAHLSGQRARIAGLAVGIATILAILLLVFGPAQQDSTSERKMLVVLPFENLGHPEDEYFAEGITEEITSRLATVPELGVIARTSTMQYKNTQKNIAEIGEELGVGYILKGRIRWEHSAEGPSRVRVTSQLIRVVDATHVWADVYEEPLASVFHVQSDIAERVANALDITLIEPERASLKIQPTENLEAYDYYLRGNEYYLRSYHEKDMQIAIQMYKRAIELDPRFALAYARLAETHAFMYWLYYDRSEERVIKTKEAAAKALELAPDFPEIHQAMGFYYYRCHLDYDRALAEFEIARRHQPNDTHLLEGMAYVRRRQGKMEQAAADLERAVELDPRSALLAYENAVTYMRLRKYSEAVRHAERAIFLRPEWVLPYGSLAMFHLQWQAETKKARSFLEQASQTVNWTLTDEPDFALSWALSLLYERRYEEALKPVSQYAPNVLETQYFFTPKNLFYAQIYGLMGKTQQELAYYDSARVILEAKLREKPHDERVHSALGIAYAGLGREQDAIHAGNRAVELMPVSKDAFKGVKRVEDLARIYAMVGKYDAAIDRIDYLLSIPGELSVQLLHLDPTWAPLHDHPRFQALIAKYSGGN